MIIRRIPGATYEVGFHLTGNLYVVIEETIGDSPYQQISAYATTANGSLIIDLSDLGDYDRVLTITVYDDRGEHLAEETVEIVRPYAVPPEDMFLESELEDFWQKEAIARALIDTVTGGFYRTRRMVSYESPGGDFLALYGGIVKIHGAWLNGYKVYDAANPNSRSWFRISPDRASIIIDGYGNRRAGNDVNRRWSPSDYLGWTYESWTDHKSYYGGSFGYGNDYLFDVEVGYRAVPSDIALATNMLIDGGQCSDEYLNKWIIEYDTDQYRIKYDKSAFTGTGNRGVDMILAKYTNTGGRIGVGVL